MKHTGIGLAGMLLFSVTGASAQQQAASSKPESVVMQKGMHASTVGAEVYGHASYSALLLAFNGLKAEAIPAGTTLKTPPIPKMFRDAGADPAYQPAFDRLGKAVADFHALRPSYLEQRRSQPAPKGAPFENSKISLRPETAEALKKLAGEVEAACTILEKAKSPHQTPKLTVRQLRQAASGLAGLASGRIEENGYDYYLVDQRLGLGLAYAMTWVRQGHR